MTKVFLYSSNLNYFIYNGFFCSGVPLLKCIDYVILALVVFVDIEDKYGVKIDDETAKSLKTVKDLVDYIETHQAK